MPLGHRHRESHYSQRGGWLRAAVLGANDGIVSTAALVLGVAASGADRAAVLTAGLAALLAGAGSMAVGEYVSVSSQRDAEEADIAKETRELATVPERELDELTGIYVSKGLSPALAREVAVELSKGDVLAIHLAEELGITEQNRPRPFQAAWTSAAAFSVGAAMPVVAVVAAPVDLRIAITLVTALIALTVLGIVGAGHGGAEPTRPVVRVVVGGAVAMAVTMAIGRLVGASV